MKTLAFKIDGVEGVASILNPVEDVPLWFALEGSPFKPDEFVTLIATSALAPLLAREAYRVHCVEKLAKRMCGCTVTYLGDPAPSGDCPDGVRLAAAIPTEKGTP